MYLTHLVSHLTANEVRRTGISMFKTIFSCNLHPISCSICEFDHIFSTCVSCSKFSPCGELLKLSYLINNLVFSLSKSKILVQPDCDEVLIHDSNPLFIILPKILPLQGAARTLPLIHNLVFSFKTKLHYHPSKSNDLHLVSDLDACNRNQSLR